jgi:hypothetical protein
MTTLDYQRAFARLLTNQDLREDFFRNEINQFPDISLSESETKSLMLLDSDMTERYSRMLVATRLNMALSVLPYTKKLLPEDFVEKACVAYGKQVPPTSANGSPTLEEVKRFDEFLKSYASVSDKVHPYLRDVSLYEINLYYLRNEPFSDVLSGSKRNIEKERDILSLTPTINGNIKILEFEYDVIKIISELKTGNVPKTGKKETILLMMPSNRELIVKSISKPIYDLMKLCDSTRTVSEITKLYERKSGETDYMAENAQKHLEKVLRKINELGFLTFV